jgi:hypothetical protein
MWTMKTLVGSVEKLFRAVMVSLQRIPARVHLDVSQLG